MAPTLPQPRAAHPVAAAAACRRSRQQRGEFGRIHRNAVEWLPQRATRTGSRTKLQAGGGSYVDGVRGRDEGVDGTSAQPAAPAVLFPDASMLPGAADKLPPLDGCTHFLNLTNGLEALPVLHQAGLPYGFCRVQSTACEQQKFEQLMNEIDANLLMSLAAGHCCLVWDYGSRNRKRAVPRAIWYGLEFARFALNKEWLARDTDAYLRGVKVTDQFAKHLKGFSRSTKRRIRYFRRYVPAGAVEVRLYGVYQATEHDDDWEYYRDLFHSHCLPLPPAPAGPPPQPQTPGSHGAQLLQEQLAGLGFRLFMGGISHQDLRSLLGNEPDGGPSWMHGGAPITDGMPEAVKSSSGEEALG
eukprot:jgi/Tetstr1/454595/TSEL_041489.t1